MSGRYEPRKLPPDDNGRVLWGVYDHRARTWVHCHDEAGEPTGQPLWFPMQYSAESWCRNQRYLNEIGHHG